MGMRREGKEKEGEERTRREGEGEGKGGRIQAGKWEVVRGLLWGICERVVVGGMALFGLV